MTHISQLVSSRGGVQNDALARKDLFEDTSRGLTEEPDWGEICADTINVPSLFLSKMRHVVPQFPVASVSQFLFLSTYLFILCVNVRQSILQAVLPESCCPAVLWLGCCWGWMSGYVPLWCAAPLRSLLGEKHTEFVCLFIFLISMEKNTAWSMMSKLFLFFFVCLHIQGSGWKQKLGKKNPTS